MERTPRTETARAVSTSGRFSRYPSATPANATCPTPSPTRLRRRWTRKKPTAGARRPTTMPERDASRKNLRSSMRVGGVVPDTGQGGRRAVEHDLSANEHDAFHELLDGAELVRDVQDRHRELAAKPLEKCCDRFLRFHVDTGRGLVKDEELGFARERLRDEGPLLLAAGEGRETPICLRSQPHPLDCGPHRLAIGTAERSDQACAGGPPCRDELAHGQRRVDSRLRPLWEVANLVDVELDVA